MNTVQLHRWRYWSFKWYLWQNRDRDKVAITMLNNSHHGFNRYVVQTTGCIDAEKYVKFHKTLVNNRSLVSDPRSLGPLYLPIPCTIVLKQIKEFCHGLTKMHPL